MLPSCSSSLIKEGGVTLVVANSLASQRDLIEGISVKGKGDGCVGLFPNKGLDSIPSRSLS